MLNITNNNSIDWGPGKNNNGSDYQVYVSSLQLKKFDYLVFADSKGASEINHVKPWTLVFCEMLGKKGYSSMLITRPKEMTIFFTLVNFLNANPYKFHNLITNLGFVDLTPKKEEFIDDILVQNPFPSGSLIKYTLCEYLLNSGISATLFSINYNLVVENISAIIDANFKSALLVGTFEFSQNIKIERKRPIEFFCQLKETNSLLKSICNTSSVSKIIDANRNIQNSENSISYDAVHFTRKGHNTIVNLIYNNLIF